MKDVMMKVFSFSRGGISYEDSTVPSRESSVTTFLPGLSVIPLAQYTAGKAFPIVSIGDTVREGMLIGRGQGAGIPNVHATVPGRVVRMISWKTAGGQLNDALVIRMEGSFERLGKREEVFPWEGMLPYDIQRVISEFGIVEMEAEGQPVSDIINSFRTVSEPLTLVVRCIFDDPWLAADYTLCRERLKAVVEGSRMIARVTRASRIIYAVSHKEKELGAALRAEAGNWDPPSFLALVGQKYPQRNRRELEQALRNYVKTEGLELGPCMILGPATLAAVHDAVKYRKPILDRYVAVGGSAVKKPQILKVRIGTRVSELFTACGGFSGHARRITIGSPLSGRIIYSLDEPVVKTTYALSAFLEKPKTGNNPGTCIGCGECRNVCPVGLDPEELFKRSTVSGKADPLSSRADECHGCGCCDAVCPSRLALSSAITAFAQGGSNG